MLRKERDAQANSTVKGEKRGNTSNNDKSGDEASVIV